MSNFKMIILFCRERWWQDGPGFEPRPCQRLLQEAGAGLLGAAGIDDFFQRTLISQH